MGMGRGALFVFGFFELETDEEERGEREMAGDSRDMHVLDQVKKRGSSCSRTQAGPWKKRSQGPCVPK